jgi:hypothetical protein
MYLSNEHIYSNGDFNQPAQIDYATMEPHTECSICSKLVKVSDAVPTYKNKLQQTLRFTTLAHRHCSEKRAADIAAATAYMEGK